MKNYTDLAEKLPALSEKNITVHVRSPAAKHLRRGHPWLYDGAIEKISREDGAAGDVAVLFDNKREMVGLGLFDPQSAIRVKVLLRRGGVVIDEEFFAGRIAKAIAKRESIASEETTGYRLIYGESDGMPGFIVDAYGSCLVIKLYSAIWFARLPQILPALLEQTGAENLVLRLSRNVKSEAGRVGLRDGQLIHGAELPQPMIFKENGLSFEVDVRRGQKTGFFLDQRDNRSRVEKLAKGKWLLNVFSYTGGFSLYAARGGATRVTSLDASQPALDAAKRNYALNPELNAPHDLICGDAFAEMGALVQAERLFSMIVIDPPSFARRASEIPSAMKAYERLTRLGLELLDPGGTLVLASCSSRIGMDEFLSQAHRAARQMGRKLELFDSSEHALDHASTFGEGNYLKCLFATA